MKHITIEANINESEDGKALYKLLELISHYTLNDAVNEHSLKGFECHLSDSSNMDDVIYKIKVSNGEEIISHGKTMSEMIEDAFNDGKRVKWAEEPIEDLPIPEPKYKHRD